MVSAFDCTYHDLVRRRGRHRGPARSAWRVAYGDFGEVKTMNVRTIGGWVLSIVGGAMFALAGVLKLTGNSVEVQTFVQFGLPVWFM